MHKIKILVIHTTFRIGGGAERFLLNFLSLFPKNRYEIDLLLFDNFQDNAEMFDAIPKGTNILPYLWQFSYYSYELMNYFKENGQQEAARIRRVVHDRNKNPDFLNLSTGEQLLQNWELLKTICPKYSGYDYAVAFCNTLPLRILDCCVEASAKYVFIHGDFELQSKISDDLRTTILSEYEHYKNVDKIICVAEQNARGFSNIFPDLSKKITFLLNVSNADKIKKSSLLYVPPEYEKKGFNILTVARVNPQKNIELLLNSADILRNSGVVFRWFVLGHIGESEYANKCMEIHRSLNLAGFVEFLGEVNNPFPYYKNCSLFVITSNFEGRSLAVEEAMILACPIVSTNFAPIYDQITDKVNGRICEMTPHSMADVIEELYIDEGQRKRIGGANVGYTGDSARDKYLEFFPEIK